MPDELQYELCPETGIGCVLINNSAGMLKIDLMPDEAADLRDLVKSGDIEGARALLASIDAKAETAIDDECFKALVREIR